MNNAKKAAATIAATAVITGTAMVGTATAEGSCGYGSTVTVSKQRVIEPGTGKEVTATVTECSDHRVIPAVGVNFRDNNGVKLNSGLSPRDQFKYLGEIRTIAGEKYIRVRQTTTGMGGWGSEYEGLIPVRYTAAPNAY